jgi:hypothetical protein
VRCAARLVAPEFVGQIGSVLASALEAIQSVGIHGDAVGYRKRLKQLSAIDYENVKVEKPQRIESNAGQIQDPLVSNHCEDC